MSPTVTENSGVNWSLAANGRALHGNILSAWSSGTPDLRSLVAVVSFAAWTWAKPECAAEKEEAESDEAGLDAGGSQC